MSFWQQEWFLITVSVMLSLIPAIIWMEIWREHSREEKKNFTLIFVLGFLSIVPVVAFQLITNCHGSLLGFELNLPCLPSSWNPLTIIESQNLSPSVRSFLFFLIFAALEEIGKLSIVKYADMHGKAINTINDALLASLVAALSFAFVENIVYFNNILLTGSFATFFSVFVFRSIFTAAAHTIFSGIAGYHYGLGKFSRPLAETSKWKREHIFLAGFFKKVLGIDPSSTLKVQLILKGLFIATIAHAIFNFLLEHHEVLWVVVWIVIGVFYLFHLLQRKSGALLLRLKNARPSTMPPRDEEVVLELVGMWINEGKYDEVMSICERLLQRDPDNNAVKLFLAEAHHRKELQRAYDAVRALFTHEEVKFNEGIFEKAKKKYLEKSKPAKKPNKQK
jgi:RsiW-degrading membrane proteinase PrsW (M82 family)